MDAQIFCQLFKGLVRPHLEYAQSVWSPHSKNQVDRLEDVQRRATKLIPGFYDLEYPQRLRKLKLPTLAYRRARGDMIEVYKMLAPQKGYDQTIPSLFTINHRPSHWSHSKQIYHKGAKKNTLLHSFTRRVQDMWNHLPEEVVTATMYVESVDEQVESLLAFEIALDKHWEDQEILYDNYRAPIVNKKFGAKLPV